MTSSKQHIFKMASALLAIIINLQSHTGQANQIEITINLEPIKTIKIQGEFTLLTTGPDEHIVTAPTLEFVRYDTQTGKFIKKLILPETVSKTKTFPISQTVTAFLHQYVY